MARLDLTPAEAALVGVTRCGRCTHLIGLHAYDGEYDDYNCIVDDCTCILAPLGPITRTEHERRERYLTRPRTYPMSCASIGHLVIDHA